MEQLAEKYWGSFGPAAMPGLAETAFDGDFDEATAPGMHSPAATSTFHVKPPVKVNYMPAIDSGGTTHTVDLGVSGTWQVRRQPRWKHIFSYILLDEGGEGVTMKMRIDAIRFLSRIPVGIAMPSVELGEEEITFEWRFEDLVATASVEGDDLVGYALKRDGFFVPGEGAEYLSAKSLPTDLLEYLQDIPTD